MALPCDCSSSRSEPYQGPPASGRTTNQKQSLSLRLRSSEIRACRPAPAPAGRTSGSAHRGWADRIPGASGIPWRGLAVLEMELAPDEELTHLNAGGVQADGRAALVGRAAPVANLGQQIGQLRVVEFTPRIDGDERAASRRWRPRVAPQTWPGTPRAVRVDSRFGSWARAVRKAARASSRRPSRPRTIPLDSQAVTSSGRPKSAASSSGKAVAALSGHSSAQCQPYADVALGLGTLVLIHQVAVKNHHLVPDRRSAGWRLPAPDRAGTRVGVCDDPLWRHG